MATKTFEELKQLAIQIRDEKTNKQNTATRVGTAMLEHINKLEQDYYDKTTINNRTSEYNVSLNHPTSGISGGNKYDLSTAIGQVPAELRTAGLKVSFLNSAGKPESWKYQGGSWAVPNFIKEADGGNKILTWVTDTATTRKQVSVNERKAGMQISYKPDGEDWVNEQYIGTSLTDTEWVKNENWDKIPNSISEKSKINISHSLRLVQSLSYETNNKDVKVLYSNTLQGNSRIELEMQQSQNYRLFVLFDGINTSSYPINITFYLSNGYPSKTITIDSESNILNYYDFNLKFDSEPNTYFEVKGITGEYTIIITNQFETQDGKIKEIEENISKNGSRIDGISSLLDISDKLEVYSYDYITTANWMVYPNAFKLKNGINYIFEVWSDLELKQSSIVIYGGNDAKELIRIGNENLTIHRFYEYKATEDIIGIRPNASNAVIGENLHIKIYATLTNSTSTVLNHGDIVPFSKDDYMYGYYSDNRINEEAKENYCAWSLDVLEGDIYEVFGGNKSQSGSGLCIFWGNSFGYAMIDDGGIGYSETDGGITKYTLVAPTGANKLYITFDKRVKYEVRCTKKNTIDKSKIYPQKIDFQSTYYRNNNGILTRSDFGYSYQAIVNVSEGMGIIFSGLRGYALSGLIQMYNKTENKAYNLKYSDEKEKIYLTIPKGITEVIFNGDNRIDYNYFAIYDPTSNKSPFEFGIIKIAAFNSDLADKENADFVCSGENDEKIIQPVIDMVVSGKGGTILFANGDYYLNSFQENGEEEFKNPCCLFMTYQDNINRYQQIRLIGQNCSLRNTGVDIKNGVQFHLTETAYNSITRQVDIFGIYAATGKFRTWKLAVEVENIAVVLPGNQKPFIGFNFEYAFRASSKNLFVAFETASVDDIPAEDTVGYRLATGSNFGVGNIHQNLVAYACREGFQVSGEHLILMDCKARRCWYGYTFNNFLQTCGNLGNVNHPNTLINCCDEQGQNMPYFADMTYAPGMTTSEIGTNQAIDFISFNLEWNTQLDPDTPKEYAKEQTPGRYRGRIDYTVETGNFSQNVVNIPFWDPTGGNGSGFRTICSTHKKVGTSSERNSYQPNLGQEFYDTNLNKMCYCIDTETKKWVDAMGNKV